MASVEDRWRRKDGKPTTEAGKGKRWRAEWIEPDGTRRRKSFAYKDAATKHLAQVANAIEAGEYGKTDTPTVAKYYERWITHQLQQRASTLTVVERRFKHQILPSLGETRIDLVDRQAVQDAIYAWQEDLAPATIRVAYKYVSTLFKTAMLDGVIRQSPCKGIKLPPLGGEKIMPLPVSVVQELVNVLPPYYQRIAVLFAATGLRSAELRGLTWNRVDLKKGSILIDRQLISITNEPLWGPPKTSASNRRIGIGEDTVQMLKDHKGAGESGDDLIFRTETGAITRTLFSATWRRARNKIPQLGKGWHELRHFHASLLIADGRSPVAVAHRLGHKDANETLATYSHLWPDDDYLSAKASDGIVKIAQTETPSTPPEKL